MAIITFTSDFGTRDHYVAAVKAKIFNFSPNIQVIDISHAIEQYNLAHGAFVLNAVFRDFPKGTVHIISVNSLSNLNDKFVAVKMEDHYFVGTDNGLLSLLTDKTYSSVELIYDKSQPVTFPEKNIFAFAAVSLANGKNLYDLGPTMQINSLSKLINRRLKITKNGIEGNVIHVDSYGNLITNISKKQFEETCANRSFTILFGRENTSIISKTYSTVDAGMYTIVFNDLGLLEIAINNGNASALLNLKFDSKVSIEFAPEY